MKPEALNHSVKFVLKTGNQASTTPIGNTVSSIVQIDNRQKNYSILISEFMKSIYPVKTIRQSLFHVGFLFMVLLCNQPL